MSLACSQMTCSWMTGRPRAGILPGPACAGWPARLSGNSCINLQDWCKQATCSSSAPHCARFQHPQVRCRGQTVWCARLNQKTSAKGTELVLWPGHMLWILQQYYIIDWKEHHVIDCGKSHRNFLRRQLQYGSHVHLHCHGLSCISTASHLHGHCVPTEKPQILQKVL